ncbi:hypothetical protein EZV62_007056 [Acer yangbiense]|uniref:Uncharacterized protein n=1 Tax=Acer yangbiense TaxID=1000413 RepID=A0A5C7I9G9_9ROSI|nr:hypothetical protein EZV62_007056 [Acer yangbiense]
MPFFKTMLIGLSFVRGQGVYNGYVPSNLTGMKIAAMRLRSGSLRTRGVKIYKEFGIPIGVTESYVERLVLVYQNLGNWSKTYYPLPGYTLVSGAGTVVLLAFLVLWLPKYKHRKKMEVEALQMT